jgi:hypothetical protein
MSVESFLTTKLRTFSAIDIGLVKLVYLLVGLLVQSLYAPLVALEWWFYLVLAIIASAPLYMRLLAAEGGLGQKIEAYLKSNDPAHQVLLFLCMLFIGFMLGRLFPGLISASWWVYVIIMAIAAIKPITKTVYW